MNDYTINESSVAIYQANEITAEITLSPLDYFKDAEFYLLINPYNKGCFIEASVQNGWIDITFDRDVYKIPANLGGLEIVTIMAEIWYDTEDIEIIREYLKDVYKK
jgi:hypothetical protein